MKTNLYLGDNRVICSNLLHHNDDIPFADVIYADCIYDDTDISWLYSVLPCLKPNGIFYIQTDYHTVAQYKLWLDDYFGKNSLINWLIYKQEWGGVPKRAFPRKHDDILMYHNGKDYKFYADRIQIPKITAGTSLDKKGTGLKTPCDVFDDLGNFHTNSLERIKCGGRNIQWQKPLKLMNRLLLPVTDVGDTILDPFMGSGSTGAWCLENDRRFIGIENTSKVFELAENRLNNYEN